MLSQAGLPNSARKHCPALLDGHLLWWPQICLSAAMTLVALPVMVKGTLGWLLPRQAVQWVARLAPRLACGAILVLSLSRVAALLLNYGAPLQVYRQLPEVAPRDLASPDMPVIPTAWAFGT